MPPLPVVPKVIRCAFIGSNNAGNHNIVSRLHWRYAGTPPDDTLMDTFATAVLGGWHTYLTPMQSAAVTLDRVECVDLGSYSGATGVASGPITGSRSGASVSSNQAVVVSLKIARRYRGGHPRVYLNCGCETDYLDNAHWAAAFQIDMLGAMAGLNDTVVAAGWTGAGTIDPVSVSYYSGFDNVDGPTGRARAKERVRDTPVVDHVTAFEPRDSIGTQRRRLQFQG